MSQNHIGEHIADVIRDMDRQIVVGNKVFAYVAQVFISKVWVFDGFEAKFRARIKQIQEDNSLSLYNLKVLKSRSVDTTAYLTFQRSSDNLRALKVIEGSWFGESKVLEKGKFLWARPFHFTNERSVTGDLNHITYETRIEDVKAFNEKYYVAQKQNVWGLVYGGMGKETERDDQYACRQVDRGVEHRENSRRAVQSRLDYSGSNQQLSSLMTLKTEPIRHQRDDSRKRMAPSESTDSLAERKPSKKEKAVDVQEAVLEVHVNALESFEILDDYIGDEIKEVWRKMEIERNMAVVVNELVDTVVRVAIDVSKWTTEEYNNNFF